MAFDLANFETQDTARIELLDPLRDNEKTGIFVTILGPGADARNDAQERSTRRLNALKRRYKTAEEIPLEDTMTSALEFLADIIVNIEGLEQDGKPFEFNRKNVIALFSDRKRQGWELALQVSNAANDPRNFRKA